ncbi:MAG: Collagenase and related protease [Desulfotomaculum sp. 46_296]|nr:MAG: Collagenase and related protease [Desulfotomaculum sp. 46_296]
MLKTPELLAPAGGWESLVAAVQNGADAVYLGGRMFNARRSAVNFENQEIARAIEYAHIRGVKVYVTVNILVADREMEEAAGFLLYLYNAGADAVIVQDLGLAALAREVVPGLELHASTQMTIHNLPGIELLSGAGFKRVVLAREMNLSEIGKICASAEAQIEVFVHGALCICYSGRCLFSSMIGGRSGNRGSCAQPCRLPYTLADEKGRALFGQEKPGDYLLSPRDLNMSGHIPGLIEAGIDAFKIEGRIKRPEYVAVVTGIYRKLIDRAVLSGAEGFYVTPQENMELAQIFNREFTTGYFYGRQFNKMMSYKRPNNRGVFLGRVRSYDWEKGFVEVLLEDKLRAGDGLEIWVTEGGRKGFVTGAFFLDGKKVQEAPPGKIVKIPFQGAVKKGDRVFKTNDAELINRARQTFTSPKESKKLPVSFFIRAGSGEPMEVTVRDQDGNTGFGSTAHAGQPASERPLDEMYLRRQMDRLGNTPFSLRELHCDLKGSVIYPAAEINRARREAVASLEKSRLNNWRIEPVDDETFHRRLAKALKPVTEGRGGNFLQRTRPLVTVHAGDLSTLRSAVRAGADLVYLAAGKYSPRSSVDRDELFKGFEFCRENGVKFVVSTPAIVRGSELDELSVLIEEASSWPVDGVLAGNLGLLEKIKGFAPVYTDYTLNAFNRLTVGRLTRQGAVQVTLSPELTIEQIREIAARTGCLLEVLVHGRVELMVSEYCAPGSLIEAEKCLPGKCAQPCRDRKFSLKDRLVMVFPIEMDSSCRLHIFNSHVLCLAESIPLLAESGIGAIRIDARLLDPPSAEAVVRAYRRAVRINNSEQLAGIKKTLAGLHPGGITSGHLFRGVL